MPLRFGVFDHIEHQPDVPLDRLYRDRLELIEQLDRGGFYCYHLAEHHTPAVHSLAPSQNVFLASVAQRTERLRFGAAVYVLPLHHPLRLIEEVCMLDNLSGGRLEIGIGPGGELEAYFWGQGSDPETNRARFDETFAILREGLAHDELTYEGRFHSFDHVPMRLRPLQRPHPPLWYMRNSETAAEFGMNCCVIGSLDNLEANVLRFRRLWTKHHGPGATNPNGTEPMIGLMLHIVLSDDEAESIELAESAWKAYRWNLTAPRRLEAERRALYQFLGTPETADDDTDWPAPGPTRWNAPVERAELDANLATLSEAEREARAARRSNPGGISDLVLAGTPESIDRYMSEYVSTDANYLMANFEWGNLTHEIATRSVQLWIDEVVPRLEASTRAESSD